MALPYIIGSGLSALLGGITYSYYSHEEKEELKYLDESPINYSMIDSKMKEIVVSSNISPPLGVTFIEKCTSIIKICNEMCGLKCSYDNSKRTRKKLGKYIREYERIGLEGFINNHKKNRLKK